MMDDLTRRRLQGVVDVARARAYSNTMHPIWDLIFDAEALLGGYPDQMLNSKASADDLIKEIGESNRDGKHE